MWSGFYFFILIFTLFIVLYPSYLVYYISALGTHISRVRSVKMDAWTSDQIQCMKAGGNQRCMDWLEENGIDLRSPPITKYDNEVASLYCTEVLPARMEGRPAPKNVKAAQQNHRWKQPWWWTRWHPIETAADVDPNRTKKKHRTLLQRIQKATSSSDFFMTAYVATLVGLPILFVSWLYR